MVGSFPILKCQDLWEKQVESIKFTIHHVSIMKNPITVILADDHQSILKSISSLLSNSPGIEVLATAENGETAIALTTIGTAGCACPGY